MKIMTIVGTRPEIIRLSRVMAALDRYFEHTIVHTGQNYDYELNQVFFDDLEIRKPDRFLDVASGSASAAETVGQIIAKVDVALAEIKPDALLVLGDTNSCLAAYPAKRRKIPVFHMEAGNRCFDQRVPEEINRKIVDHISDINMPYSDISREYLLREGLPPDRIIKTGSPMYEVLHHYLPKIQSSDILKRLSLLSDASPTSPNPNPLCASAPLRQESLPSPYFLLSAHREENIDDPAQFAKLIQVLNGLAETYGHRVIVSTHPRTRKRIEAVGAKTHGLVELMEPMGFCDYVKLQMHAKAVLSDSGTISEESSILNFPALNIRNAHERPEAMEEGSVMMVGLEWPTIQIALGVLEVQVRGEGEALTQRRGDAEAQLRLVHDYAMPNVSEKVARIILSYTGYVNRVVWHR